MCKGVTRVCFTLNKFAFPCDQEVPCVCAILGYKVVERSVHTGKLEWGVRTPPDPVTGKMPLFAKISTVQPKSAKAVASGKIPEEMRRG